MKFYLHDPFYGWRWRRKLVEELKKLKPGEMLQAEHNSSHTKERIHAAIDAAGLEQEDFVIIRQRIFKR